MSASRRGGGKTEGVYHGHEGWDRGAGLKLRIESLTQFNVRQVRQSPLLACLPSRAVVGVGSAGRARRRPSHPRWMKGSDTSTGYKRDGFSLHGNSSFVPAVSPGSGCQRSGKTPLGAFFVALVLGGGVHRPGGKLEFQEACTAISVASPGFPPTSPGGNRAAKFTLRRSHRADAVSKSRGCLPTSQVSPGYPAYNLFRLSSTCTPQTETI